MRPGRRERSTEIPMGETRQRPDQPQGWSPSPSRVHPQREGLPTARWQLRGHPGAQQRDGPTDWVCLTPMGLGAGRCHGNKAHVWTHVTAGGRSLHLVGCSPEGALRRCGRAPHVLGQRRPVRRKNRLASSSTRRLGLTD